MSDGERNSEDGDADGQMDTDQIWGNDHGDEAGISGGGIKTGLARESEVIMPEEVKRWGVVLVQGDNLDGELARSQVRPQLTYDREETAFRPRDTEHTYLRLVTPARQGQWTHDLSRDSMADALTGSGPVSRS